MENGDSSIGQASCTVYSTLRWSKNQIFIFYQITWFHLHPNTATIRPTSRILFTRKKTTFEFIFKLPGFFHVAGQYYGTLAKKMIKETK